MIGHLIAFDYCRSSLLCSDSRFKKFENNFHAHYVRSQPSKTVLYFELVQLSKIKPKILLDCGFTISTGRQFIPLDMTQHFFQLSTYYSNLFLQLQYIFFFFAHLTMTSITRREQRNSLLCCHFSSLFLVFHLQLPVCETRILDDSLGFLRLTKRGKKIRRSRHEKEDETWKR